MEKILLNIGYVLLLINFFLFLKSYTSQDKAFKCYTFYIGLIVVIQLISYFLKQKNINNLFLSHFYFIGQFLVLSYFYWILLEEKYQKKIIKFGSALCFLLLIFQYSYNFQLFFNFNLFEIFLTSFLLILYSTFYFYNLLSKKNKFYYLNMGVLIYIFGSSILFLSANLTIMLNSKYNYIPWLLNSVLYIVYQLFVLIEWKKNFSKKNYEIKSDS
jgi:hypothetical protein